MTETQTGNDGDAAEIVTGPREQIFHLLAEASEIEHTLMCSYLYAAFSLRSGQDNGLSTAEAATVKQWQEVITSVATEEMVHLLLVANLSIALGTRPHFGRPNFPVAPGYFPSGVVVKLAPFSAETLEHFIYLERPQGVERRDGAGFEHELDYVREDAYDGVMPSVQDYATVGRLYEALRTNLIESAKRLGERALFIGPRDAQVGSDAVQLEGVIKIVDLDSALLALDTIVEQGEGSPSDRENSHYQRFLRMKEEYAALLAANPAFCPSWPVVESPVMRRPPDSEGKVFVEHPAAAPVLDLANAIYGLLLRLLVQVFHARGEHALQAQQQYLESAIKLMHLLARTASSLARLPAGPNNAGNAGVSFTMLRGIEPLFEGPATQQYLSERFSELARSARKVARDQPSLTGIEDELAGVQAHHHLQPEGPTVRAS